MRVHRLGMAALLISAAIGQSTGAQDRATMEAARVFVEAVPYEGMIAEAFTAEKLGLVDGLSVRQRDEIGELLRQMILRQWPQINQILIGEAARTFTSKELAAMNAFNATPEGKAILTKSGPWMQNSMAKMAPLVTNGVRALMPEIQRIAAER